MERLPLTARSNSISPNSVCHSIWRLPSPPGTSEGGLALRDPPRASMTICTACSSNRPWTGTDPGPSHPRERPRRRSMRAENTSRHSGSTPDKVAARGAVEYDTKTLKAGLGAKLLKPARKNLCPNQWPIGQETLAAVVRWSAPAFSPPPSKLPNDTSLRCARAGHSKHVI